MRTRIQTMRKPKIATVAQRLFSSFSRVVSTFDNSPPKRSTKRAMRTSRTISFLMARKRTPASNAIPAEMEEAALSFHPFQRAKVVVAIKGSATARKNAGDGENSKEQAGGDCDQQTAFT